MLLTVFYRLPGLPGGVHTALLNRAVSNFRVGVDHG
jgi:hypothetical protein